MYIYVDTYICISGIIYMYGYIHTYIYIHLVAVAIRKNILIAMGLVVDATAHGEPHGHEPIFLSASLFLIRGHILIMFPSPIVYCFLHVAYTDLRLAHACQMDKA